jgi:C-terminal processing protease CtpA/Prc
MKNKYFLPAIIFVAGIASGAFVFVLVADTIFSRGNPAQQANVGEANPSGDPLAPNNPAPNNIVLPNNPAPEVPDPDAPRLAEGPTDKQLERLRKSLAGQMLQDQTTGKILTANQLSREQLVMLWEQMNPKRAVVQNMPEMPKPDETARDIMGSLGANLGESEDGVRVTAVKQGTPAANAGMRSGDIVTKVNSRQINKLDDIKDALERGEAGKPARVEVSRRGEFLTLNIPR